MTGFKLETIDYNVTLLRGQKYTHSNKMSTLLEQIGMGDVGRSAYIEQLNIRKTVTAEMIFDGLLALTYPNNSLIL